MPPTPKAPLSLHDPKLLSRTHSASPGEDIVITGVSGKFPNSNNVEEFAHNLYNKVVHKMDQCRFNCINSIRNS